jgi:hypothetical protein
LDFFTVFSDGRIQGRLTNSFVRKAGGSLRLCIDYRGLNEVTRKNTYPLPRVDDTLDDLKGANFYTHLDLAFTFRQVRVREDDVHMTAF